MSKKFYVVCDDNCRSEGMNKEQIYEVLAKNIPAARTEGDCLILELDGIPIPGDDSGFITTLKETNAGKGVSLWVGTEAEFNAISPAVEADSFIARIDKDGKVYVCTDDSFIAFLRRTIQSDKIMVGAEELDADLVAKLRNGGADATYEIINADSFKAALIEQARSMAAGTERLVYFIDDTPAIFSQGYGLAKMYHHQSSEQGGTAFVCVDIYSANEKYVMNVVKSDLDGTWACTKMLKIATNADTDEILHHMQDLDEDLHENYYTSTQVDDKIADARAACTGFEREFDSGDINAKSYTQNGNKSKIYTLHLRDGYYNYTATIDYRHLVQPTAAGVPGTIYFSIPAKTNWIELQVNVNKDNAGNKSVTFYIDTTTAGHENHRIMHICGYY